MAPRLDFDPSATDKSKRQSKALNQHVSSPQILRHLMVLNTTEKPEVAEKFICVVFFKTK